METADSYEIFEKYPNKTKVINESIGAITKLSNEKMQSMNNREFLSISPERRLENITKNNIKSEYISAWTVESLEFSFTFDWVYNRELYLKTTAWQVLPKEVWELKIGSEVYTRKWLKWEFFTAWNKRLIIHEWTKIDIEKIRTKEEVEKINKENETNINIFKKSPDYEKNGKWFDDIVSEAIKRGIDPKFTVLAFAEKVKDKAIIDNSRRVEIEEMFTQFDRLRSWVTMWNWEILKDWKYPDELVIRVLKEFGWDEWKNKAEKYWIKPDEITRIENLNTAKYLDLQTRQEIVSKAPDYIKNLVRIHFPASEYENALLVCHWESGFNKYAINNKNNNWTIDRGLFQINSIHYQKYSSQDIFDPEVNIKIVVQIFNEAWQTWRLWYAARKIWLWF